MNPALNDLERKGINPSSAAQCLCLLTLNFGSD